MSSKGLWPIILCFLLAMLASAYSSSTPDGLQRVLQEAQPAADIEPSDYPGGKLHAALGVLATFILGLGAERILKARR